MMIITSLYGLAIEILTFWMPIFYTFKYVMNKDTMKVPAMLKFWCMLSLYGLISLLLQTILDDKIFPIVNIIVLAALNIPPYQIAESCYEATLGPFYRQNKKSLQSLEETLINIFNKNTETMKNKVKDSTGEKMKGFVGQIIKTTLQASMSRQKQKTDRQRASNPNKDSDGSSDD